MSKLGGYFDKVIKGLGALESNKAIESIGKGRTKVLSDLGTFGALKKTAGLINADRVTVQANSKNMQMLKRATGKKELAAGEKIDLGFWNKTKLLHMNPDGTYNTARTAASVGTAYVGASAAGRVLSGGGLYKDSKGNTDIIGVPLF